MKAIAILTCAAAVSATACSSDLKCADGTFRSGHDCVAVDPGDMTTPTTTADPAGRRARDPVPSYVTLTSDKPATIFYTTDGSDPDPTMGGAPSPLVVPDITDGMTLRFFAVDAAGHREPTETASYVQDITPPAAITNLAATVTNGTATVTWTNPPDPDVAGTIIARVSDLLDGEPVPGTVYPGPMALTSSVQLISVGAGTQLTDPGLANGTVRYAAWSYDNLGNYSLPTTAVADVGLLGTGATYTFNTGTSALTEVVTPTDVDLTGTTASFASGPKTVTLALKVKNTTTKYFQNPKIQITGVSGAAFSNSDGVADTFEFSSLGTHALAPGATVTRNLVFTGAAPATTVTINLVLGHHASLFGVPRPSSGPVPHEFVDIGGNVGFSDMVVQSTGSNNRLGGTARPGVVVAGHFLDVPTTHGTIERWDLTTFTLVDEAFLGEGQRANVMSLVTVAGREIAVVKSGGRRRSGQVQIVRLDEGLHITGRLDLARTQGQGASIPAISHDGSLLAQPVDGGVALIDVVNMKQIDADPSTPQIDLIDLALSDRIRAVTFFNGTIGLVALTFEGGDFAVVKLSDTGYTTETFNLGNSRGNAVATTPDGRVWLATDSTVQIYDPATDQLLTSSFSGGGRALTVMDGQLWVLRTNQQDVDLVDATGAVLRTVTLPGQVFGHWLQGTDPP